MQIDPGSYKQLVIVIPTYNEAENLPTLVASLLNLPIDLGIVIVDDNSPDGTGQIADGLAGKYPGMISVIHRSGKQGLGAAYIAGFNEALTLETPAIGQMDADFSHPPEKIPALMEGLQTCDVSIGSRYIPGGGVDQNWPLWRKGLSAFGNFYARTILGLPIQDTTGAFRIWRREALEGMPLGLIKSNGYVFLIECAYIAHRLGYCFHEAPFYFADRRWGKSKMSLRVQIEAAFRVLQIRFVYRRFAP